LWFAEGAGKKIGRITTTGTVSEFLIPGPSHVHLSTGVAAGPDGALWFGVSKWPGFASGSIGRITTTGEFSEFLIPTPSSSSFGITVGSDGAVWFTETRGNKIGRLTTTGEFSEFVIPTPNSGPYGITVGSDGAVWFTERDKIGRIGQIDEDSTEHIQATEEMPTKGDTQSFHWERWILYLEIATSLAIIIAKRLK
jgi:virginiamycin B lyase